MRNILLILVAVLIVGGFIVYMSSFTVRFTEAAVVTTFGHAGEGDVIVEPGLRLKWPAPIQNVTVYDTRARFLTTKSETQQTADDRQIIVEAFLTWRVKDPLVFYKRFRSQGGSNARDQYAKAQSELTSQLRSAMSEVSKYRLGDLFTTQMGKSRLGELETNILERLRGSADKGGGDISGYGVEVVLVGINSVVLPENTTKEVFTRMTEARKRLAAKAESEGQALATAIRSEAENAAKRIREFAKFRADQIRNRGDLEAAPYLAALNEDPALAVYLKELEFLRAGLGNRATLVLPTSMTGLGLLSPEAPIKARQGKIPGMGGDAGVRTAPATTGATP